MKVLTRILLVNWYLFDAEAINITGNLLVVGPTGSGKTSLLDAIQTVLLGGHGKHIKLNANASDKSARNLRGYCLGLIREEAKKNDGAYQIREDAVTHLALVFEDDNSGEKVTIGACLSARRSEAKHRVEGLYILPKQALGLDTFLDEERKPISWEHLRGEFKRNANIQQNNELYLYGSQPEKYIEQLCISLGPNNRFIDSQKYVRSLQKAINLQDVENVSDFVKHFILDDDPIDIDRMERSIKMYRELLESAEKTEKQINKLSIISKTFLKSFTAKKHAVAYQWIQQEFLLQEKDFEKSEIEEELVLFCQQVKSSIRDIWSYKKQQVFHEKEKERLLQIIAEDNKEQELKNLERERSNINSALSLINEIVKRSGEMLEEIADLVKHKDLLPEEFSEIILDLAKQLSVDSSQSLELTEWPEDPVIFDKLVISIQDKAEVTKDQVQTYRDNQLLEFKSDETYFKEQRARLENLKKDGSDLRKNTRMLIEELNAHNIEATPVCDFVDVTDETWQPAIEAYLKSNMEALYVDPDDAENAVRVYRNVNKRKHIYGATVINTKKTGRWVNREIPENSCALFLTSENKHALAYLQNLLRHVICVETEQDLMNESRAITIDGMLHRNGGITRMKLEHEFLHLGKQARKNSITILTKQIQDLSQQLVDKEKTYAAANTMQTDVNKAFQGLSTIISFTTKADEIIRKKDQLESNQRSIDEIDLEHLKVWKEQLDVHKNKITETSGLRDKAFNRKITTWREYGTKQHRVTDLDNNFKIIANERTRIESVSAFDSELVAKHSEDLESENDDPQSIQRIAKERESKQFSAYTNQLKKAQESLFEYRFTHEISNPKAEETEHEAYEWVNDSLQQLENTELANYKEQASIALNEAQIAFRSDVAVRLKENILKMKQLINEINSNLKKHTFSGNEMYQFQRNKNKEYENILEYIEQAEFLDLSQGDDLFEDRSGVDEIMKVIEEDTEAGEEKLNKILIADYRNYYHYDIRITDTKQKHTHLLSKRIGTASGGEHRTPYYVAIGASLASAYRIESKEGMQAKGGIGLAILDEAFEKMDGHNSLQAADYLKELGLQLILAAPDEAELKLLSVVDTVIFITREGTSLDMSIHYPKEACRKLLMSDNPFHHPELIEQRLEEQHQNNE